MKKVLKIVGFSIGGILVLLLIAAAYIHFKGVPSYKNEAPELTVVPDSMRLARGEQIVNTICIDCHGGEEARLDGRKLHEVKEFGEIWAPNITNHPTKGAGRYTDGELAYLFRTGIKKDGQYAPPYMPKWPHISDEDLQSIIVYLRSDAHQVQATEVEQPASKPAFLTKMLTNLVFKPYPYPTEEIIAPPITDKVSHGRYLATAVFDCYSCHSASFTTTNILEPEKTPGFFGGGNPLIDQTGKKVLSANITMHEQYGIGAWTEEDFIRAVRSGVRPDGTALSPAMPKHARLTVEEVSTIWAYLQTVPILDQEIVRAGF